MRYALVFTLLSSAPSIGLSQTHLDQGWTAEQRDEFHYTPQGSHLIPYKWFLALEQADAEGRFRSDDNLQKYGILPNPKTPRNPDALPVGFVRDGVDPVGQRMAGLASRQKAGIQAQTRFEIKRAYLGSKADQKLYPQESKSWFGLTCAACHTHEIEFGGNTLRIDGGANQADLESFLRDLGVSLEATHRDTAKLERFAKAVGRAGAGGNFKREVEQIADAVNARVKQNKAKHPYGYARLDAFGSILNAVCETALDEPRNHFESNAPVSYPSLWNAPAQSYVQWAATAAWAETRNVGEVLGVFGAYSIKPGPKQFDSTIRFKNLLRLEHELLTKLRAPDWPEEVLGKLDQRKVRLGRTLFERNCESCHIKRGANGEFALNPQGRIPVSRGIVGTDPQFLQNLSPTRMAFTNDLAPLLEDKAKVSRLELLGLVVGRIMAQRGAAEGINVADLKPADQAPPGPFGYISRPLEGIWATAPYFHNGSVPNLYETLLPSAKRSKSFWTGTRKFDPVKVGFVTTKQDIGSLFSTVDDAGMPIAGNSNVGHEGHGSNENEGFTETFENGAWREFTEDERYALVEYMKSLSSRPKKAGRTAGLEQIPEDEAGQIRRIVRMTAERMRKQYTNKRMLRGVHPKDHGCVTATFKVREDLPKRYAVGIFKPGAKYEAFIRFSNAAGQVGPDSTLNGSTPQHGSRGMAVKLMGVQGKSLLPPHGALTQDLLLVNQPSFAFANVADYEVVTEILGEGKGIREFIQRQLASGDPATIARAKRSAEIAQRIAAPKVDGEKGAFETPPASPVDATYFGAAPFLFGPGRVMKYRATPIARSKDEPNTSDENYLRTALIKRLAKEDVTFDFAIQVRKKNGLDIAVDVENASTVWPDEFISVATITIPKQEFDSPEQREACEQLFFTPWHGIKAHRPLGGINRLRRAVYLASAKARSLPKEPASGGGQ